MSPPVRVLISFSTRIGSGGVGTTAWHQATGLARAGAAVSVVCGSVERPMPGVRVLGETMRIGGAKLPYRAVGFERATAYHDRRVANLIRRRHREFDVLHAWPAGAERSLATARAHGLLALLERPNAHTGYACEVVAGECDRIGMRLGPSSPHAVDARRLAREEREYAAADALLCPSDFVADSHRERGAAADRLLRHRYGYDPARFFPAPDPRAEGPLTVAFVGRLEPRKGVHLALDAWRRAALPAGSRLILCGEMEPGYDRVLAPLLELPGVELRGHTSDPRAVMAESDALVLPTLEEGSALVTYEARGCGAVLLVSDHSGAVAEHEHDALVHRAGDVDTLAGQLRRLAGEPGLLDRLRSAGLRGVDELTWDAAAGALADAYAEGLARRAAQARGLTPTR
jgi:glycosyltransferase involved in cell wall biosynthesis